MNYVHEIFIMNKKRFVYALVNIVTWVDKEG